MRTLLVLLALLVAGGCVYPRRGTSLTAIRSDRSAGSLSAPADVWKLTVVSAQVRPRRPGDLTWDDGGGLPDRAGSLTPATAMGHSLVDRLRAAGHTYEAG